MAWSGAVYQCLKCDHHYLPEYGPIVCPECGSKEREQTGTVEDPAKFIADVLNHCDHPDLLDLQGPEHCQVCGEVATTTFYQGKSGKYWRYCAEHFKTHDEEAAAAT